MGSDRKALFGVFDGHGGREVAVWCHNHYQDILTNSQNKIQDSSVEEWLRTSFLAVDDELRKPEGQNELGDLRRAQPPAKPPIFEILDRSKPKDGESQSNEDLPLDSIGCTANVMMIDRELNKIFVINAGDSRCTMGRGGACVEMSIDHKPESQTEIDRITKAGSEIVEGRVDGNLNLTRSLGDLKYKQREHLKPEEQAITANPDVYSFDLTDDIDFIIMGCDGIWERKTNEEMVAWVYETMLKKKDQNNTQQLKETVSELLLETISPSIAET
jgi:serine/threonine protein phosphatase PrpC